MISRGAFDKETLEALGWMSIVYAGVEEFLADYTAQLLLSEDLKLARNHVAPMPTDRKRQLMDDLVKHHCEIYGLPDQVELRRVLGRLRELSEWRNDLIHGFITLDKQTRLPVAARARKNTARPLAAEEINRLSNELFETLVSLMKTFAESVYQPATQ